MAARSRSILLGALLVVGSASSLHAQTNESDGPAPVLTYRRQWPAQQIPDWTISITLDGSGHGTYVETPTTPDAAATSKPIHLSPRLLEEIEPTADVLRSGAPCARNPKGLANTGTKTLTLTGGGPDATCAYMYAEDKRIQDAEQIFFGIAETMQTGVQLDRLHRFDRLGLDKTIHSLQQEVVAGRAVGLENIAPALRSLVQDTQVLERVRLIAQELLDRGAAGQ